MKSVAVGLLLTAATGCASFSAEAYVTTPQGNYGAGIQWQMGGGQMGGGGGGHANPGSSAAPSGGPTNSTPTTAPVQQKSQTSTTTTGTVNVSGAYYTAEVPNSAVPTASGDYSGTYSNLRFGSY